jgi:RNA polymerase sigma factor (sigma-70 family)
VKDVIRALRQDLPDKFAQMMMRLTSHDRNERPDAEDVLDTFEEMAARTTTMAEHELGRLVSEAARSKMEKAHADGDQDESSRNGVPPKVCMAKTPKSEIPGGSTASVMNAGDELVRDIVKRVTAGLDFTTDARDEFLAQGRLGLLEAHREFDRKHRSGANFETFAFQRVQGRVQEAFTVLGGFPRAVYRAAKKNAAMAREQAHGAGQVHTKDYLAQRVCKGADQLHLDPFTAIGERLEKHAVRAAIERLPDASQREVLRLIYVDGLAQNEVCELLKRDKTRVSRIHKEGVETVQKLLLLGSALDKEQIAGSLARLDDPLHRLVLQALYKDRLDYRGARGKLGVTAKELEGLHQAALAALVACFGPTLSKD